MANKTLHTKVSLTSFKEFSPDETPRWVINVIISDTNKEYSKFCEPIFEILQPRAQKTIFELKNPISGNKNMSHKDVNGISDLLGEVFDKAADTFVRKK